MPKTFQPIGSCLNSKDFDRLIIFYSKTSLNYQIWIYTSLESGWLDKRVGIF